MKTNSENGQAFSKNTFEVPTEKNNRILVEVLNRNEINSSFQQLKEFDFFN